MLDDTTLALWKVTWLVGQRATKSNVMPDEMADSLSVLAGTVHHSSLRGVGFEKCIDCPCEFRNVGLDPVVADNRHYLS